MHLEAEWGCLGWGSDEMVTTAYSRDRNLLIDMKQEELEAAPLEVYQYTGILALKI